DFADRDHVDGGGWPVSHATLSPWYATASAYLDAGPPEFAEPLEAARAAAGGNAECRLDRLERWSEARNLRALHGAALAGDAGPRGCLGAVATGFDLDPVSGAVRGLAVALPGGDRVSLPARAVVLACGGLETTRLLLIAQTAYPRAFGGAEGPLGR